MVKRWLIACLARSRKAMSNSSTSKNESWNISGSDSTAMENEDEFEKTMRKQHEELKAKTKKFYKRNPGVYDDVAGAGNDVFPRCFDGLKFTFSRPHSTHFNTYHTFSFNTGGYSGYGFRSLYVGDKMVRLGEVFPMIQAEYQGNQTLDATIVDMFADKLLVRLGIKAEKGIWKHHQTEMTYYGQDWTSHMALINPSLMKSTGVLALNYLQRISSRLDVGGDLVVHKAPKDGPISANSTFSARLFSPRHIGSSSAHPSWFLAGTVSPSTLRLCFQRECSENFKAAATLEVDRPNKTTELAVGYSAEIPNTGFTYQTRFSSSFTLMAVLEKKFANFPLSLSFSSALNCKTHESAVGIGIMIG